MYIADNFKFLPAVLLFINCKTFKPDNFAACNIDLLSACVKYGGTVMTASLIG